ncbi:MAG: putative DNA-binding domain-containing protein [Methylotenera sp.]|uniref:HvfC family RiPP maturation protein n=1 Tax=Methylotenera sp. TaxID=2051956 RepID=UPI002488D219|nr:putative DNA-binding domain-containing protein [Methylotenera sp.]MDI1309769.1 putative DNA-binding domain-containing protein [Methylotenera sp.]
MTTKDLLSFQHYQLAFTSHIRDPLNQPRPKNVKANGMDVYKEIVFNNLFESVSACFPVAQKVIGKRGWHKLIRGFFSDHSSATPIFRKIPEEFLAYLSKVNAVTPESFPVYLISLCHYEWVELLVSTMKEEIDQRNINAIGDLRLSQPAFAQTMQLLNYEYAVQKISPRYKPKDKVNSQLLVFRNTNFEVKFIELNTITYRLIELLKQDKLNCEQALTVLAREMNPAETESIIQFGLDILEDLRSQGVILGVY